MKNIIDTIYSAIECDEAYKVDEGFYKNVNAGDIKPEDIQQIIPIEKPGYDCVGQKISTGDWVIFAPAGAKTNGFQLGFAISVNKRVNLKTIAHQTGYSTYWNTEDRVENLVVPGHRCFRISDKDEFYKSFIDRLAPEDQQRLRDVVTARDNK